MTNPSRRRAGAVQSSHGERAMRTSTRELRIAAVIAIADE
jgi:hypothetical protein